jgi:hypothetical protein
MSLRLLFAILAIVCFLLSALGQDRGKGLPVGLILLTLALVF